MGGMEGDSQYGDSMGDKWRSGRCFQFRKNVKRAMVLEVRPGVGSRPDHVGDCTLEVRDRDLGMEDGKSLFI